MPLFSVIVPIYNIEKYLPCCVDSILCQTFSDFQLVLVDDGSKDDSPVICDDYAKRDSRITVIHKENGGLVSARKAGLKMATGDYIVPIDGDDYVAKDYLSKFAEVVAKYRPDIVCCDFIEAYADKDVERRSSYRAGLYSKQDMVCEIFPSLIENKKSAYFGNNLWSKAIKRELYAPCQNFVDDRIKIGEDLACSKPMIFACESLYIMHDCLYFYRQNNASMTKNKKPFDLQAPKIIARHLEQYILMSAYDFQDQVYRMTVHHLFNACYSQFYRKEKYKTVTEKLTAVLQDTYYQTAIKNCKYAFANVKGRLALFSLKHRCFLFLRLYSKIK